MISNQTQMIAKPNQEHLPWILECSSLKSCKRIELDDWNERDKLQVCENRTFSVCVCPPTVFEEKGVENGFK